MRAVRTCAARNARTTTAPRWATTGRDSLRAFPASPTSRFRTFLRPGAWCGRSSRRRGDASYTIPVRADDLRRRYPGSRVDVVRFGVADPAGEPLPPARGGPVVFAAIPHTACVRRIRETLRALARVRRETPRDTAHPRSVRGRHRPGQRDPGRGARHRRHGRSGGVAERMG